MIEDIKTDIYGNLLHYRNDERLRRAETKINLTAEHIEEIIKCKNDIIYFIENYCKINDPNKGWRTPKLYDFQKTILKMLQDNKFSVIMCSRQTGKTTTLSLFICWYMTFFNDKSSAILANKGRTAREVFGRVMQTYRAIPQFLKCGVYEFNKSKVYLDSGSTTIADTTTEEGLRSHTVNGLLMIDEAAIIDKNIWEEFYTSVLPTMSAATESKMVIISTPKGRNHFFEIWNSAVAGENGFAHFKATWRDVPGRDEEWKKSEIKKMTGARKEERFRQEYEVEFLSADTNSVFSSEILAAMGPKQPIAKQFENNFRVYELPIPNMTYACCVDCGQGLGEDYSVVQVIHTNPARGQPFKQVATYACNTIDLTMFPHVINKISKQYNNAIILIENNAEAFSVVKSLVLDLENENVFNHRIDRDEIGGIKTTTKSKRTGISALKELLENNGLIINDFPTVNELGMFVKKGTKMGAKSGFHDDLVMALSVFGFFTTLDIAKEMLDKDMLKDIHMAKIKSVDEDFISPIIFVDGDGEQDDVGSGFNWNS